MTDAQRTSIDDLKKSVKYFERNIENNSFFKPEFETSKKIVELIESTDSLTDRQLDEIVEILNAIKISGHYDGSGWMDFQMKLNHYLRTSGFQRQI
jgi:hypothetical protein